MRRFLAALTALSLVASPALADEISDTLQNALDAYNDGDLQYALEELEYAKQQMLAMKTDALTQFLPDAADGYTRTVNTEMNAGLAMMGGGVGAEAEYQSGSDSFTITIMADNPMVGAMSGMIGNAALMGARIKRVGREKFMLQNNELSGLIDKRILVQAKNGDVDKMIETLETMDFRALGRFGN